MNTNATTITTLSAAQEETVLTLLRALRVAGLAVIKLTREENEAATEGRFEEAEEILAEIATARETRNGLIEDAEEFEGDLPFGAFEALRSATYAIPEALFDREVEAFLTANS